ncbi:MAG TPA: chorismate synthase, partial [Armatimonadetes bacterium]|nr:chorismate synthase [Armatimonadota bacterium]
MLRRLRLLTAGESHGASLTVVLEGIPAGLEVDLEFLVSELRRRQRGYGRGPRASTTADTVEVAGGVVKGRTTGAPLALRIPNPGAEGGSPERPLTIPRPGHADLPGAMKFGLSDMRLVWERASARETASRVAAGAICKALLSLIGVRVGSHVTSIGSVWALDIPGDIEEALGRAENSPVRCADPEAERAMVEEIDRARERGDTLGGTFEVVALGVPPGLGSYAQFDQRLDARLAASVMSIPSVKAVEIGGGFSTSTLPGVVAHDPILPSQSGPPRRGANRAGGVEGGISNGEPVVVRAGVKPVPTLGEPMASVDLSTGEPKRAPVLRGDVCVVPAAAVVGEAMVALVLADSALE